MSRERTEGARHDSPRPEEAEGEEGLDSEEALVEDEDDGENTTNDEHGYDLGR